MEMCMHVEKYSGKKLRTEMEGNNIGSNIPGAANRQYISAPISYILECVQFAERLVSTRTKVTLLHSLHCRRFTFISTKSQRKPGQSVFSLQKHARLHGNTPLVRYSKLTP